MAGAKNTGIYPNRFEQIGISEAQVNARLEAIFQEMFYGDGDTRIYHPVDPDMGYMEDTGNHDARTEGMSYGMMMCVQTDHKEEFDRIWKWAKTYMYMEDGANAGYFSWSNAPDGSKNAYGPAPDGEEYFVMALFFASHRWGDGEGIFEYSREAREILHTMINKKSPDGKNGREMFAPENHYIRFITEVDFTDPSYHLPHFYELCAEYTEGEDAEYMKEAAKCSREYLHNALHPETALNPEYSYYDGTPYPFGTEIWGRHDWFYSDAYRTIMNIALDSLWFDADPWEKEITAKHLDYWVNKVDEADWNTVRLVDGTPVEDMKVLHPIGLLATITAAALVNEDANAEYMLNKFWNTPLRDGDRRYYDNCLYFFAFLMLSGNYRIY